jgi:hypothetical protein
MKPAASNVRAEIDADEWRRTRIKGDVSGISNPVSSGRILTFASLRSSHFCECLTFAHDPAAWWAANVRSTPLAPSTAAARRGALLRSAISAGFFNLTLNPDHGKDDDGSPDWLSGVIDSWALPPRSRIRWKFNDGPHTSTLSGCRSLTRFAATVVIKNKRG